MLLRRSTAYRCILIFIVLCCFSLLFLVCCNNRETGVFENYSVKESSLRIIEWDGEVLKLFEFKGTKEEKEKLFKELNSSQCQKSETDHIPQLPVYVLSLVREDGNDNTDRTTSYAVISDDHLFFNEEKQYKTPLKPEMVIKNYNYNEEEIPFYGVSPFQLYVSRISPLYHFQKIENNWNVEFLTKATKFEKEKNVICSLSKSERHMELFMKIQNYSDQLVSTKEWFNIQTFLNGDWYVVPFRPDVIFPDYLEKQQYDMIAIGANEELTLNFDLDEYYEPFPEGSYRISYGNITEQFEVDSSGRIIVNRK